jgi:hypothetical protein
MRKHISFQPIPSSRGTWTLAAIWDHVLRERILGLEFASEDQALCWVSERSHDWLARREFGLSDSPEAIHTYVPSNEGGKFVSIAGATEDKRTGSIYLVAHKYGRSLHELMTSDVQDGTKIEVLGPASRTLLKALDVAPGQVKRLSGMHLTDRPDQSS